MILDLRDTLFTLQINNVKKNILSIAVSGMLTSIALSGIVVSDPVSEFPLNLSIKDKDRVLKLEVNFDKNRKNVIFLSLTHHVNGKVGNIWTAYIPTKDGYLKTEETDEGNGITFPKDSYYIGSMNGFSGNILAYYFPGGGGKGALVGYQLIGNAIHEVIIKENAEPGGADKELFEKIFSTKSIPVVEEIDLPK